MSSARAGDRPYLLVSTAAAEEDDEQVWSVQTHVRGDRRGSAVGVLAEYAFDPLRSAQLEVVRAIDRSGGDKGWAGELEFKQLFNHIARDDWGIGVSASLAAGWSTAQGGRAGGWTIMVPASVRLPGQIGLAHLNLGLVREPGEARQALVALGVEGQVARRTTLFGELARLGDERLVHAGVRYWIQRERIALDVSLTDRRIDGARVQGAVLGLAWYDL